MNEAIYTHKGIYGLCPVYLEDPERDSMVLSVAPRHWMLSPLFWLSDVLVTLAMVLTGNRLFFAFVTGELKQPIRKTFEGKASH